MNVDDLFPMRLVEMDWYEMSPLVAVLKRNRGRWIHFSRGAPNRDWQHAKTLPNPDQPSNMYDRRVAKKYTRDLARIARMNAMQNVPKLGINPKSQWRDPKGIYFYPVDWVLGYSERIASANQFGLSYPYYYIADVELNDPGGINLATVTWAEVEAIAQRNGWYEQMMAFRQLPFDEQKHKMFSYSRPDLPGSFLWHFVDRMVQDGKITWTTAFRGISYIRDPNLAIIHSNEPDQLLVLAPRLIRNVQIGENKTPIKPTEMDKPAQWTYAMLSIIKAVRGEVGGDLTWKDKKPTLAFRIGNAAFSLAVGTDTWRTPALRLIYTWGRADGSLTITNQQMREQSAAVVVERIVNKVKQIGAMKTDLLFKPLIPIAEAKRFMMREVMNNMGLSIKTEIHNGENEATSKYSVVYLRGKSAPHEINGVPIAVTVNLGVQQNEVGIHCNVRVGRQEHAMYGQSDSSVATLQQMSVATLQQMLEGAVDDIAEHFDRFVASEIAPLDPGAKYGRHPRLEAEQLAPFKGWMVLNCGLSLGGLLSERYREEIAAYEKYSDKDRLLNMVRYVFTTNWHYW